jgi:short-subunit dehydrogenase
MCKMKRIIIIGATSGIGREVAKLYIARGWQVGVAGRRTDELEYLRQEAPQQVYTETIDVTHDDAPTRLQSLIDKVGGMDIFLLSSGIGKQNPTLEADIELRTASTNVTGFIRMTMTAYHFFAKQGYGHIAAISSIAGTKGLGIAPAYSATKCFQNTYLDALDQLAHMNGLNICFTDIRPGFVATPLLKDDSYPLLMKAPDVATQIVKGIDHKKRTLIIDWRYRILVFFWRLIPRCIWLRLKCVKN